MLQICYVNVRHAIRKLRMPTLCSENAECIWIIIAREYSFLGTMRKSSIKMYFFYFKAFSHVMGYHDGTQNFTIRKYDILAFKWRVLSIFSIPGSKVIPKNKRTLVKCPGLYIQSINFSNPVTRDSWKYRGVGYAIVNEIFNVGCLDEMKIVTLGPSLMDPESSPNRTTQLKQKK